MTPSLRSTGRRRAWRRRCLAVLVSLGLGAAPCWAAEPTAPKAETPAPVVFKPPLRGAPGNRVGASSRTFGAKGRSSASLIVAVAPPGGGLTASAQPVLHWQLDYPLPGRLTVGLVDESSGKTVLAAEGPVPVEAGLQSIPLADYGVTLAPNRIYRWTLAIVPPGGAAGADASGNPNTTESYVECVAATVAADAALSGGADQSAVRQLAAEGLWYDALAAAVELADQDSGADTAPLRALLRHAGLESRVAIEER